MVTPTIKYQCCFCGKNIESTNIDPCSINAMINFDKTEDKQHHQDFFCHFLCLKKILDKNVPLYLEYLVDA